MRKSIVAFGEIMLRLSPMGKGLIKNASGFDAVYGGTESNVLVCLSGLGHKTKYASAIPDNALGDAVEMHLHRYGVDTSFVIKKGDILGLYYLEEGFGNRSTSVIYNRKFSEIARLNEAAFSDADYDGIFSDAELFHISGISFGLSDGCRALSYKMIEEARRRSIEVSFDCNYRAKVWGTYPAEEFSRIVRLSDIVFCSKKDLSAMNITDVGELFENSSLRYLVCREKEAIGDDIKAYCSIFALENGEIKEYKSKPVQFRALEKIGGGDAFDAGILHSLLENMDIDYAMELALGAYEYKHTVCGDVLYIANDQLESFMRTKSNSKGVVR